MTNDRFIANANSYLDQGRVNTVISVLLKRSRAHLHEFPDLKGVIERVEKLADTYKYMQEFLLKGMADPQREEIYRGIKNELRKELNNYLFITNTESSSDEFFSSYRLARLMEDNLHDLTEDYHKMEFNIIKASETEADPSHLMRKKEELLQKIFINVWVSPQWNTEQTEDIRRILTESGNSFELKAQTLSALFLSLLKFYDEEKIKILVEAYNDCSDDRLAARLLTVLVLTVSRWHKEVSQNRDLTVRLESVTDSLLSYTRLRDVVMTLIKTRDTDRVSKEIKETFEMAMKNVTPEMLDKLRQEGLTIDAGELGENPEWEKIMKENNLEERMQEINEMQMNGMDIMIETFGKLKTFSFFRNLPNWFLPFNPHHSEIGARIDADKLRPIIEVADSIGICESDRYSFIFGLMQMPQDKIDAFLTQINGATEMIKEQFAEDNPRKRVSDFAKEAISFCRDLYRFFKLYPRKAQFFNIYENPIDFINLPVLNSIMKEEEILMLVSNFYFSYGYYDQARPLFEMIVQNGSADMEIYEKIGYCYQMGGDFASALDNYERAELFSSDASPVSTWLLRKLALCHKALNEYEEAARFYEKILERSTDDLQTETNLGNLQLLAGKVDEAVKHLSKVNYMDPANKNAARGYVRALLKRGNSFDMVKSLCENLLGNNPDRQDYVLMGHASYATGDYENAARNYTLGAPDEKIGDYRNQLLEEINFIAPQDFDNVTFTILLDKALESF